MVKCRGCGDEVSEKAYFCPRCGLRTEAGEEAGVKTPMSTRPGWERDVETALSNATKLMEDAFEAAKKGLQRVADEIEAEVEKARDWDAKKLAPIYCPKCGSKNPSDSQYCTDCGKEIPRDLRS
jgi:rRNA maturation endonuclease Nob1